MIILDTETTDLILPGLEDPTLQPRMIEVAAVSLVRGEERAHFSSLVNPGVPLSETTTKITGLTDAELAGAPTFPGVVQGLIDLFRSDPDNCLCAHNVQFDLGMLVFELRRIGWEWRFPYCQHQRDTVTESGNKKLIVWAREVLGEPALAQTHRAMEDVQLLIRVLTKLNSFPQ